MRVALECIAKSYQLRYNIKLACKKMVDVDVDMFVELGMLPHSYR